MGDSLGDRMKRYENVWRIELPRRMPVIIRVDGRAFHTFTRGSDKPFDAKISAAMDAAGKALCEEAQGACIAFVQSDEVSVLLHGYKTLQTQPWLDNNMQKIASVAASIATVQFNLNYGTFGGTANHKKLATFDGRAFTLPEDEVCNYFLWRQQDATRNSIQMAGQKYFSPKQLHKKSCNEIQEMLFQEGVNWDKYPTSDKRGRCLLRSEFFCYSGNEIHGATRHEWKVDPEVPIFSRNRAYINDLVYQHEDKVAS